MSYVVPNNRLVIFRDIPIERNYQHSLYFTNQTSQSNYFSNASRIKYTFNDMSHIRVTTPGRKIRVEININDLYDCNYLAITNRNTNSPKTFYCFIDNVEYVNENVSEISYSIDVLQTWMFQYSTAGVLNNMCFVEREHVRNDTVGANLVDENLNTGDLINGAIRYDTALFTNIRMVLMTTAGLDEGGVLFPAVPKYFNGTCHAMTLGIFNPSAVDQAGELNRLRQLLTDMSIFNRTNTIVNFIMMPLRMIAQYNASWEDSITDADLGSYNPGFSPTLGTYTPKNNKLLTYPYTFFTVDNHEGTVKEFKYEMFPRNNTQMFEAYCDFSPEPSVTLVPRGYGQPDLTTYQDEDMSNAIKFTNFPKCTYAVNDLAAKFVQAGIGVAIGAATKGLSIGLPGGNWEQQMPNIPTMGAGDVPLLGESKQIQPKNRPIVEIPELDSVNNPAKQIKARLKPLGALTLGSIARSLFTSRIDSYAGNGNILIAMDKLGFEYRQHYIRPEIAKIIDDYFTMYGYAVNTLKYPSFHNRRYWTYIKTRGCTVSAGIPNDDADAICDIFDNGVTFWDVSSGATVGDYTASNTTI